jgi:hypothetical protein
MSAVSPDEPISSQGRSVAVESWRFSDGRGGTAGLSTAGASGSSSLASTRPVVPDRARAQTQLGRHRSMPTASVPSVLSRAGSSGSCARATSSDYTPAPPSPARSGGSPLPTCSGPSTAGWPTTPSAGSLDTLLRNDLIIVDELHFLPPGRHRYATAVPPRRHLRTPRLRRRAQWPFGQWGRFCRAHRCRSRGRPAATTSSSPTASPVGCARPNTRRPTGKRVRSTLGSEDFQFATSGAPELGSPGAVNAPGHRTSQSGPTSGLPSQARPAAGRGDRRTDPRGTVPVRPVALIDFIPGGERVATAADRGFACPAGHDVAAAPTSRRATAPTPNPPRSTAFPLRPARAAG